MRQGDRMCIVTIMIVILGMEKVYLDAMVNLDAEEIFSLFWLVPNYMLIDESKVLSKDRERVREVSLVE